jgi:hypothetical protein
MRHDRIIELFGGNVALGDLVGRSDSAVSRWRVNGIPPQYWLMIVALSRRHASEQVSFEMIAAGPPVRAFAVRPKITKGRTPETVA